MLKIEEYELVADTYDRDFNKKINDLIKKGFQPFGLLKIEKNSSGIIKYIQAMVKYEEPRW